MDRKTEILVTADFSLGIMQTKWLLVKSLKHINHGERRKNLYPVKKSLKTSGKTKIFRHTKYQMGNLVC